MLWKYIDVLTTEKYYIILLNPENLKMKVRGSSIKNGGVCEYLKGSIQNPIKE